MDYQKTTLDNGLRVVTVPMPSMESATIEVFVKAGTKYEKQRVNGLTHFLEHMVFKGTENYPTAQAVASAVDSIGAEINAHTHKEGTAYYIKAWEKHLDIAVNLLSEFIKSPLLSPEEIEREKGVIVEEIALYNDTPMYKAPMVFEDLLYEGTQLGLDVLGTRETVMNIKREDFINYRKDYYRPDNMVIGIAGRFDHNKVVDLVKKAFNGIKSENIEPEPTKEDYEANNGTGGPQVRLVTKKTEQAHLVLGVRGNKRGHPDRFVETVLTTILGEGMSSRLFTEIRERRGLGYYVRSYVERFEEAGYLATRAGVKVDKVEEAVKVIVEEYQKMQDEAGISQEELIKAKEYTKGKLALGLEDTHSVCEFFGEQELLEEKIKTPKDIIEGIDKVTVEDVARVAKEFFQPNRLNLVVVGPAEDAFKFEGLLRA